MKPEAKRRLRESVSYFGLQVKYVGGLSDKVFGFLQPGPNPRFIIINERKSRVDHSFTIAHELAHYVMHFNRPARSLKSPYLDHPWKSRLMIEASQMTRNWYAPIFDPEWEANLWAFILLWRIGAGDDLFALTKTYPDKRRMLWYSWAAAVYTNVKQSKNRFLQELHDRFGER